MPENRYALANSRAGGLVMDLHDAMSPVSARASDNKGLMI